jgi:putative ABC transport system permease protein
LIATLIVLAAVMGAVGLLGLASTMSINVLERTRELGVMQSLGATPATIRRMVVLGAVVATLVPALRASRISIREAIAYV